MDLDPDVVGGQSSGSARKVKREMNNNDPLYAQVDYRRNLTFSSVGCVSPFGCIAPTAQVRNLNFGDLGPLLHKLARGVHDG